MRIAARSALVLKRITTSLSVTEYGARLAEVGSAMSAAGSNPSGFHGGIGTVVGMVLQTTQRSQTQARALHCHRIFSILSRKFQKAVTPALSRFVCPATVRP